MLDEFIVANRDAIIARAQQRVATRTAPKPSQVELSNGIPVFLEQLGDALRLAKASGVIDHGQLARSAASHGHDLHALGLTVAQVVRDYGDVCQAITDLAVEQQASISSAEFRTLNLCLDDAIAAAVTEYATLRESAVADEGTERLGVLAHELRNHLNTAAISFELIKSGRVAVSGSTGAVLDRSLMGIRNLIDRSLTEVRLDAGVERREHISVAEFVEEAEIGALIQARATGVPFSATSAARSVTIEGDRQILAGALANLLQNAFKFTLQHGAVSLTTRVTADRVLFDVEDCCGGLPPGKAEDLFLPFEQRGSDRTGVGLGLSIALKAAQANGGALSVRDLPGKGCIFTLDLPKQPPPPLTLVRTEEVGAGPRVTPPATEPSVAPAAKDGAGTR